MQRLCIRYRRESRVWLIALCVWGSSCTPIRNPKIKPEDNAQKTEKVAESQPTDDGASSSSPDKGKREDAGTQRIMPGVNADSQPSTPKKNGGAPAESGGSSGSAGTRAAEAPDASVTKPSGSQQQPPDEEDESYVPRRDPAGEQETVLAVETADYDSLMRLASWNQLPTFAGGTLREQNVQDRGTGSRDEVALFPTLGDGNRDVSNFICRGAQATVGSGTIAYLYDEGTCPEQYVRGVEMARFTGSGRMVRVWMTATSLAPGVQIRDEWLRIYVDDNPRAILQVRLDQVLGGAPDELFAPPFGSGASNAFAWHYPVAFSTKLVVALDHLSNEYFYEIDAVLDDVPQRRVAGGKRRSSRDVAHARLANPDPVPTNAAMLAQEVVSLGANQQRHIELTGPATIDELVLRVPKDKLASLSGVRIAAHWDDAMAPAIDLPLLSLFAAGRALPNPGSLALTSQVEGNDAVLRLRLPMPFSSKAAWDLTNAGTGAADFTLVWNGEASVPDQPYGRLHVQFQEPQVPLTENIQPIATVNARGRLVGLCADIVGRSESSVVGSTQSDPMDLARGDVRIMVDDELALQSTATDHYANNALYFGDSPKSTPFAQTWERVVNDSEDLGSVSFCRWHVLGNEIDFKSSLNVVREVAQRDPSIIRLHRTVAYVYVE